MCIYQCKFIKMSYKGKGYWLSGDYMWWFKGRGGQEEESSRDDGRRAIRDDRCRLIDGL